MLASRSTDMRYSPQPMEAYYLPGLQMQPLFVIQAMSEPTRSACWNYLWLVDEGLDVIPASGNPHLDYVIDHHIYNAVAMDLMKSSSLINLFNTHPATFCRMSHVFMPETEVCRQFGTKIIKVMQGRAMDAARMMSAGFVKIDGDKVTYG